MIAIIELFVSEERRYLVRLQLLFCLSAIFELANVFFIGLIFKATLNAKADFISVFDYDLSVYYGLLSLILTTGIASSFSIYVLSRASKFGSEVGMSISSRTMEKYLNANFNISGMIDKSTVQRIISVEIQRASDQLVNPLLQSNFRIYTALTLLIGAFIQDVILTSLVLLLFMVLYGTIFTSVRSSLRRVNSSLSKSIQTRIELVEKCTNALKDAKINRIEIKFLNIFTAASENQALQRYKNIFISVAPKYLAEFTVILGLVLGLLFSKLLETEFSLENLGVFGLI